jgi:hypothetical protein
MLLITTVLVRLSHPVLERRSTEHGCSSGRFNRTFVFAFSTSIAPHKGLSKGKPPVSRICLPMVAPVTYPSLVHMLGAGGMCKNDWATSAESELGSAAYVSIASISSLSSCYGHFKLFF